MGTRHRWVVIVAGALAILPRLAAAQDIEAPAARIPGREMSAAYVEQLRQKALAYRALGGWIARVDRTVAASQPVTGDLPLVALPALFLDSPDPVYTADDLSRILFDGPAEDGTLAEYYAEVSGGRLAIYGEVGPWVQTSLTLEEVVGSEYGLGDDARTGEYLVEALTLVDPGIDFGLYDNDGLDDVPNSGDDDGIVDAVAFYFPAISASCGGDGIWPHFWGISGWTEQPFVTDDPRPGGGWVEVDPYFVQSIVTCDGADITPITTVAHELGHNLGLPDLYHPVDGILPQQRRWVVGCWSLMAAGSWGCGEVGPRTGWRRPTHFGAWEKRVLGWLDEIEVVPAAELLEMTLAPVQANREILEIPLGVSERLLVEYRERTGFDLNLPAEGVLIYRVNDTVPWRPCPTCLKIYGVSLVEADGDSTLLKTALEGGNWGEPGDAFGALGPGTLTGATEPSTRLDGGVGGSSGVNIYEVTLGEGSANILVSTVAISLDRLLGPLLLDDANPLTEHEQTFLDARNNGNGRYDVGDLRSYLHGPGQQ
ncbi:MAG: M6 family metalloprotease domain-containing protein [Gemmatimonadota bacterium]|nr:MAG: M6 family metalloprotease domain-containing protein [Gemmatimonadota bacterium]